MTITKIIEELHALKKKDSPILKTIRSFSGLITALNKLDDLVEMERAKESIVVQLRFLMLSMSAQASSGEEVFKDTMLHTVISGPPGTGKSRLGSILAEIWHCLGLLKNDTLTVTEESSSDLLKRANDICDTTNLSLALLNRRLASCVNSLEWNQKRGRSIKKNLDDIQMIRERLLAITLGNTVPPVLKVVSPIFKVVSRVDLVAGYSGQTAIKTRKLLERMLGGVLFIDEAYSLITDEKDSFGMEALTTLNQFMSEHPNQIIVIFAGYTELMNETIFKRQPGLKRRCSWFFDIDDYSPSALTEIFTLQMERSGWKIDKELDLKKFFEQEKEHFTNFGGDTEKFSFYCRLYHMNNEFVKMSSASNKRKVGDSIKVLNSTTLQIAFDKYKQNRVERFSFRDKTPPFGIYT